MPIPHPCGPLLEPTADETEAVGKAWNSKEDAHSTVSPLIPPAQFPRRHPKLPWEFAPLASFPRFHRADDEG
jgi:hypothetical protein